MTNKEIKENTFFDLDHILKVINTFLEEVEPYWGYEEKVDLSKKVYQFHNYLLEDDETIIETAKLLLNGTNNTESNSEEVE